MDLMEKIRRAISAIENLPSPTSDKLTIFTTARPAIEKALKDGQSLKKIADVLAAHGVPISLSMLRNYLQTPPTQKSTKTGERSRGSAKKSPDGSSANPPRTDTPSPAPLQNNALSAVQVQGVSNTHTNPAHRGKIHEDF
jgi:hypothetical protein